MRKKGFEFNFGWLFAMLAGAVILFLAIYFAVNLVNVESKKTSTIAAKQLTIIFEPMETGLASGKSLMLDLKEKTKIYNKCYTTGIFGKQKISIAEKTFGKWHAGENISIKNKYIFSRGEEEGKNIYLFSKSLKLPWKISEIVFLTTQKYCFIDAPEKIREEVIGLGIKNIRFDNCTEKEIKVCFGKKCEISVFGNCLDYDCESEYDFGYVEKNKKKIFYVGSLIYGAIFSSPEIYECNVKRLMSRLKQQALIYLDEASFLSAKCGTLPKNGLLGFIGAIRNMNNSEQLILIKNLADEIDKENENSECKLW